MQLEAQKCMSGPSSLNVSTYTLRRPSTISMNNSFRRPGSRTGLVYMHKDSLIVPPPKLSQPTMTHGTSAILLPQPNSGLNSLTPGPPQRRSSTAARLERQKSHRDEDNPPAFLDVPCGVEAEPGGDSLSPLPSRKLFRRQTSQQLFLDTSSTTSIFEPAQAPIIGGSNRKLNNQSSNESESSLSKSFNILTPPTIVEIGCSNPDLTVIQNNAAPTQTTLFQPVSSSNQKSASLLSTHLLKTPDETPKDALYIPPRDVQETSLNIPSSTHDRRNSTPMVFPLNNHGICEDKTRNLATVKRLRDAFAKSQSRSRPEMTISQSDLADSFNVTSTSQIFSRSLKESRSSSSSKGLQDSHSSSSGLSTMTTAATVSRTVLRNNTVEPKKKQSRSQSRNRVISKLSYHALLRQRTRRTCSQSYCICKNCIRYIEPKFANFSCDLYYVLMTRKLWSSSKFCTNQNVSIPLDIYTFVKRYEDSPSNEPETLTINTSLNRKTLFLLSDKIKTTL